MLVRGVPAATGATRQSESLIAMDTDCFVSRVTRVRLRNDI